MEVFVKFERSKTVSMEITRSDSVDAVKRRIEALEGIPVDDQILKSEGKPMADGNKTVASYNVKKNSTLEVLLKLRGGGMPINHDFNPKYGFNDKTLIIEERGGSKGMLPDPDSDSNTNHGRSSMTVNKEVIKTQEDGREIRISQSKNCYVAAGTGSAELLGGCRIEQAFFKIGDKTICVDVHPWDTLRNLTDFTLKRHGCPLDDHILLESGKVLRDYNYKIWNSNRKPLVIQALPRLLGGAFQVTVKLSYKSSFSVSISELDTVDDLKSIIEKHSGVPKDEQLITIEEKVLNEGRRTIASYNVAKEAVFQVTFSLGGERK